MLIKMSQHKQFLSNHKDVWLASTAVVSGQVEIGNRSSIGYNTIIHGSENLIRIGYLTSIQDDCFIETHAQAETLIGNQVTIGSKVTLSGCKIGNGVIIGDGVTIMEGAEIGDDTVIKPNTVVFQNHIIPPNSIVGDSPAQITGCIPEDKLLQKRKYFHYLAQPVSDSDCFEKRNQFTKTILDILAV